MGTERDILKNKKRIVVKVGSSSLTHPESGDLDLHKIEKLVRVVSDLMGAGKEMILVSSGAIAAGRQTLSGRKAETLSQKQAFAAVGQARLMMLYQRLFSEYGRAAAQVLLTKDSITGNAARSNAINTFNELLSLGVIPVVNENDTVSTHEIEFGDNDRLSALVAAITGADLLLLMSDIDGLYTDDPRKDENASFIPYVDVITPELMSMGKDTAGSDIGTGGMAAKLLAARIATDAGSDVVIAGAYDLDIIYDILNGKDAGTLFLTHKNTDFDIKKYLEEEY